MRKFIFLLQFFANLVSIERRWNIFSWEYPDLEFFSSFFCRHKAIWISIKAIIWRSFSPFFIINNKNLLSPHTATSYENFYVPKWTQCFVWKIFLRVWEGVTARQKFLMKSNKNGKSYIPNIKVPCKQQGGAIKPNSTVHITRCSRKEMEDLPRDPEKANMKEICRVTTLLRPHQERNSHAIFLSLSLGIWYLTPLAFIVVLIDPENTR